MAIDDLEIFDNAAHGLEISKETILAARDAFEEVRAERDRLWNENAKLRAAIADALTGGHIQVICWAKNEDECLGRCRALRDALKGNVR